MYEFEFRTGKVSIDYGKCDGCTSFACVNVTIAHSEHQSFKNSEFRNFLW